MKLRCDGCRFYELGDDLGHCHFLPPSQFRDVRNDMWTPFPVVQPDWWCAQHEPNNRPTAIQLAPNIPAPEDDF